MGFKPFKALTTLLKGLNKQGSVLQGRNVTSFRTIAGKAGVINYNPRKSDYSSTSHSMANNFFVYPINHEDQEHYILFDIIERKMDATKETGEVGNRYLTKRADNLDKVVYGANRFFSEGTADFMLGVPTGKGSARDVKNTIAIYMPQTLKFNLAADYGAEEIGMITGAVAKIKDAFNQGFGNIDAADLGSIASQAGKAISGLGAFATGGLGAGVNAAIQRRTGIAPAAMQEMIFNGIDYRTFSFTFKFTPRSKEESDVVNQILHAIKDAMLPERYGRGSSIAAFKVPHEFTIRFMKGTSINPYIDQIGLCACTGVDIDYGSDKFSTHPSGDPVSIDATLTFRELELMERKRYNELRLSASNAPSTAETKGAVR